MTYSTNNLVAAITIIKKTLIYNRKKGNTLYIMSGTAGRFIIDCSMNNKWYGLPVGLSQFFLSYPIIQVIIFLNLCIKEAKVHHGRS